MKNILLLSLALLIFAPTFAQSETKVMIELKKKNKRKQRYIKINRFVKIVANNEITKGKIDSISPTTVYIDTSALLMSDIESITIKLRGTQITGAIIGTGGLLFVGAGLAVIADGLNSEIGDGRLLITVLGIVVTATGVIPTTIGAVFFFSGKTYRASQWEINAVELIK